MTWLVYENADELTKIFVGMLLILAMITIIGLNIYFWISDKIKKRKK
jgi:hypothetical protein